MVDRTLAIAVLQAVLAAVAAFFLVRQLLPLCNLRRPGKTGNGAGRRQLPPGPRGLPWLGSLLSFSFPRSDALVKAWTRLYGPLITVQLGTVPVIFVRGRSEVKQVLLSAGGRFDSRPLRASRVVSSNNHRSIDTSPYNGRWRELRKNLSMGVLGHARIAAMGPVRSSHINKLVRRLREHAQERPQVPVAMREEIRFLGFSLLLYIIFGKVLKEEQVRAMDAACQKMFQMAAAVANIGDLIPWLAPIINRGHNKRLLEARSKLEELALPLAAEIRAARAAGTPIQGSYIDSLVELEEKEVVEPGDYMALCAELLNAGTDTTASGIEFAMAELVKAPQVQAQLAGEIAAVCGDWPVEQSDIFAHKLPCLRAVALETLRCHSPACFTLPHQPLEDQQLGAYTVPRTSFVVACIQQLGMDPDVWPNPEEFRPQRFLDGPPVDITGTRGAVTMIPFGVGSRMCPGMSFALAHMQHVIGRLVQEFEWLPCDDAQPVDLTHVNQGLTVTMKHPLHARIRCRSPLETDIDRSSEQ